MKKLHFSRAIFLSMVMMLMIVPVAIGGQISIYQTVYSSGLGGEFAVDGLDGVLSYYANSTKNVQTIGYSNVTGTFQSFCLEHGEVFYPGTKYYYSISDRAYNGGLDGSAGGDHISVGTAYLYSQFAAGALSSYFNDTRRLSADDLQQAIWYLEGESNGVLFSGGYATNNKFLSKEFFDAHPQMGGTRDNAVLDAADGLYGVHVLNVWTDTNHTGRAQDQLVYCPVPEPVTLLLYGFGLLGLGVWRRCRKS